MTTALRTIAFRILTLSVLSFVILPLATPSARADAAMEAYDSGDFETARTLWRDKAYSDPYAAYNLGTLYETGRGVTADYKEAFKWYEEAARDARGDENRALKRQTVLSMARLVIKNRDHDFYATASMYISTEAMKTGDPEALRMRGLLHEFLADYSIEKGRSNADGSMKFAWGLLRLAADRGSRYADQDASRVWSKVEDKPGAHRMIGMLTRELEKNGVQ